MRICSSLFWSFVLKKLAGRIEPLLFMLPWLSNLKDKYFWATYIFDFNTFGDIIKTLNMGENCWIFKWDKTNILLTRKFLVDQNEYFVYVQDSTSTYKLILVEKGFNIWNYCFQFSIFLRLTLLFWKQYRKW